MFYVGYKICSFYLCMFRYDNPKLIIPNSKPIIPNPNLKLIIPNLKLPILNHKNLNSKI